jgi:hypothetical protein
MGPALLQSSNFQISNSRQTQMTKLQCEHWMQTLLGIVLGHLIFTAQQFFIMPQLPQNVKATGALRQIIP